MNKFFIFLLATTLLTACGGGGSDKSESPTLEVNKAPIAVADEALVQNNQVITINVLSNDTDSDGDKLSISKIVTQPSHGTVAIDNDQLVYTPEFNYAGVDELIYQTSDGKLSSETIVNFTINHTMVLSGKVTDSPIANAKVSVEISGEVFQTTADGDGNYQLPIIINDMTAMLEIRASGSETNGQANVELVIIAGGIEKLLNQVDAERILTNNTSNNTNITHVSTAAYLLIKDRNDGTEVGSAQEFEQLKSEISAGELIHTAAFIKLLIDNDDFDIPEGQTVITALESMASIEEGQNVVTADAIQHYLETNDLIDENGDPSAIFNDAIAQAIANTLSDQEVVQQFTDDMISGKKIIALPGTIAGWNINNAEGWYFNADHSTKNYVAMTQGRVVTNPEPTWAINEGKLELNYSVASHSQSYLLLSYPFYELVSHYGFDESVRLALEVAVDEGTFWSQSQIKINSGYTEKSITLLAQTENVYQVNVVGTYMHTLVMPESISWQGNNPTATIIKEFNTNFAYGYQSLFADKTLDDIQGDWVLSIDYDVSTIDSIWDQDNKTVNMFMGDKITLTASEASGLRSKINFSSSLDEQGQLVLTSGDTTYKIKPILQAGKSYLASTEKWVAGEFKYIVANTIAKFDQSYSIFTDNLVTEFPEAFLSHINGGLAEVWDGDKLKLDSIWGYKFNADGSLYRGISGIFGLVGWYQNYLQFDHFSLGNSRWTWDKDDNIINFKYVDSYQDRHRIWEVVSVDEQGRAIVFEHSIMGLDNNYDGQISEDETGQFLLPRLNILKKDDLNGWGDAWQNTIDAGLIPGEPTAPKIPKQSQYLKTLLN